MLESRPCSIDRLETRGEVGMRTIETRPRSAAGLIGRLELRTLLQAGHLPIWGGFDTGNHLQAVINGIPMNGSHGGLGELLD